MRLRDLEGGLLGGGWIPLIAGAVLGTTARLSQGAIDLLSGRVGCLCFRGGQIACCRNRRFLHDGR